MNMTKLVKKNPELKKVNFSVMYGDKITKK